MIDSNIKVKAFSEDWEEVKAAALATIHKKIVESSKTSSEWKEAMIVGRHSPIREFRIKVTIENIPRWIADQLVRHNVGVNNYMGTMRPDRGNIPRNEQKMTDTTVFKQTYNIDSFLNMCNTRLCVGVVSKETREIVERILNILRQSEPEIAKYCAPPCILYHGCKEEQLMDLMHKPRCNHFNTFMRKAREVYVPDISERYQSYKEWRWKE